MEIDSRPFFDPRLRRCGLGGTADVSPVSLRAAAMAAAALLAVEEFILFRRLIRWVGFMAPSDTECECCLEVAVCRGKLPDMGREVNVS